MNQALPAKTLSLASNESPIDNARLSLLCGQCHRNIKIIEDELMIKVYQQGSDFVVQGKPEKIHIAQRVLEKLYALTAKEKILEESKVYQVINNVSESGDQDAEYERVHAPFRQVVAKSKAQSEYMKAIDKTRFKKFLPEEHAALGEASGENPMEH